MNETGSVRTWILAFVVLFGAGTALLVGIGCGIGANSCPFTKKHPVTTTDGRQLFLGLCAACHGQDGTGSANAPSLVKGEAATLSLDQLRSKIANGKPLAGMPAYKRTLNEQQVDAVARYVASLRVAP